MVNRYLSKHAIREVLISDPPAHHLDAIVVVPAYAEENLSKALESLFQADRSGLTIEVIVVINQSVSELPEVTSLNLQCREELWHFAEVHNSSTFRVHTVWIDDLPTKKAGVGIARKIGMDEAIRRFDRVGRNGLLLNYDADCECASNYFTGTLDYFRAHPTVWAAGIYFEHPLSSAEKEEEKAIILYELHLRYFIYAQSLTGVPFAFHTIGSSMVVTSIGYQKMGGMNSRQAGEDFYFLQKFIAAGRFGEILNVTIYPSSRPSFRVPFGTGRAVGKVLAGEQQMTYSPRSFILLKKFIAKLPEIYCLDPMGLGEIQLEEPLASFFKELKWIDRTLEIRKETANYVSFSKRFFQWFNAFQMIKYVHHCRTWYPDEPVVVAASQLAGVVKNASSFKEIVELLNWYRTFDRNRTA